MRRLCLAGLSGVLLAGCESATMPPAPSAELHAPAPTLRGSHTHIMAARGGTGGGGLGTQMAGNPIPGQILYHGGPILPVTKVAAVYWATNRIYANGPTPGSAGPGSADGSLVGYFLNHLGGSRYFNINTTYYDQVSGGHTVQNAVSYTQYWAPTDAPLADGSPIPDAQLQTKLIAGFTSGTLTYDPQTIYAVFTAGNTNLGGGFGTAYCAYHGIFTWNSPQGAKAVIFAAQPYNQQFPSACSANLASPNGDAAADREINTLAHEIEESTTDYQLNAWFDAPGNENADKCAWTFGTTYPAANGAPANMPIGAKHFLIQQNWVNQGAGSCLNGLGGITGTGGLTASIVCLCNTQPVINAVLASGNVITLKDNGGHTGTINLNGATASGGLTASIFCLCNTPAAIVSIVAAGNVITVKDNGGHAGTITLTGATGTGGLTASVGCLCSDVPAIKGVNASDNLIALLDGGGHRDYIILN